MRTTNYFKVVFARQDHFWFFNDRDLEDLQMAYRAASRYVDVIRSRHPGTNPQLSVWRSTGYKILPPPRVIGDYDPSLEKVYN